LKRPECIRILDRKLDREVLVVTPTGRTYMYWEATAREAQISQVNLGLCTPVGLGLALALPHRKVVVLDGDGNLLFNLASLADVAVHSPRNLISIVFDNECYQSCDGLPSATSKGVDLESIARGCGIKNTPEGPPWNQLKGHVFDLRLSLKLRPEGSERVARVVTYCFDLSAPRLGSEHHSTRSLS
jgi:thiamine pyrophosphate-dependent acetolactate synthase large subunit-like protein